MRITRKEFLMESAKKGGALLCLGSLLGYGKAIKAETEKEVELEIIQGKYVPYEIYFADKKPLVSIVKINEKLSTAKGVDHAVAKAIDLIGGINTVAKGKERILLKPNLAGPNITDTTKPYVIESLAVLMKKAGMKPLNIDNIEVVGEKIENVRRQFKRPMLIPYSMMKDWYGPPCKNEI